MNRREQKPDAGASTHADADAGADAASGGGHAAYPPIGLIAAGGGLPVATAEGIHRAGRSVACVALRGQYAPELVGHCDQLQTTGMIQLGKWIRTLRRWGVHEAIMVGKVYKDQMMYKPLRWFRYIPDVRAAKVWFGRLRDDKRSDRLLAAIADEMQSEGIMMIDSTRYIPQLLADEGVMTRSGPSAGQRADIDFALPIVRRLGGLDIGQAIAVKDRDVIAVEAIEGTDAMIERAGALCRRGRWTLIKLAKPGQDMRFDVPTVGLTTIAMMRRHGATCLAVEAGRTILLDKPELIEAANQAGIAILGVTPEPVSDT